MTEVVAFTTTPSAVAATHTSRRVTVAAFLALAANSSAGAIPMPAPAGAEPDAELIQLCGDYLAAVDRFNRSPDDADVCPHWAALVEIEERLEDIEATTLPGIAAMARVAQHLARQPDGSVNWSTSYTGDWPAWVAQAVLRLGGRA